MHFKATKRVLAGRAAAAGLPNPFVYTGVRIIIARMHAPGGGRGGVAVGDGSWGAAVEDVTLHSS